jgi:hypothetical protein
MAAKCKNSHSHPSTCMSHLDEVKIRWQQLYKLWKAQSTPHIEKYPGKYTVRQVGKDGHLCITHCAWASVTVSEQWIYTLKHKGGHSNSSRNTLNRNA